jgi:hypothetical protein
MKENLTAFKNSTLSKAVFILSMIVSCYWCLAKTIAVYRIVLVGVIFEILWLPSLAMLVVLPIISIVFLSKEKFSFKSLYIYSILMAVTTLLFMLLSK